MHSLLWTNEPPGAIFWAKNGFLLRKAVQDAQTFLGPKNKKFCGPFDIVGSVLKVRHKQKIAFLGDFLAWVLVGGMGPHEPPEAIFSAKNYFLHRKAIQYGYPQTFLGPERKKFCGPFDIVVLVSKVRRKRKNRIFGRFFGCPLSRADHCTFCKCLPQYSKKLLSN